jgi:hypothetical protein
MSDLEQKTFWFGSDKAIPIWRGSSPTIALVIAALHLP